MRKVGGKGALQAGAEGGGSAGRQRRVEGKREKRVLQGTKE